MHTVLSGPYRYALRMETAARNPASAVQAPSVGTDIFVPPKPAVREMLPWRGRRASATPCAST